MTDPEETVTADYFIPSHVLHREVDGQMVLLDLVSETYFGLDGVGADIVARLVERPFSVALDGLVNDYEVEPATIQADVERLVGELVDAGLLAHVQR